MTPSASIVRSVVRAHVVALVLAAASIVVVGTVLAAVVLVLRDDATAVAQARTLDSELDNHLLDTPEEIDAVLRRELDEQRWFSRPTEVYRRGARLGGDGPLVFADWTARPEECWTTRFRGEPSRLCVVRGARDTVFVMAAPLAPILAGVGPIVGALALTTFASAVVFAFVGATTVRRRLEPLSAFERALSNLSPLGADRAVASRWGAAEVDSLAATFNALLVRIDEAVERERRFVADAAHELRSPLTRLRGQIELALAEVQDGRPDVRRLEAGIRSCSELARTTEALLAMARDEVSSREVVNVADVARREVDALTADERGSVQVVGDDELLVRGDEALIGSAVRNLLENATKYGAGRIVVHVSGDATTVDVRVSDEGPGIPESELHDVQKPFVRGIDAAKRARGSGLGLALARHVARLHAGSLSLRNRASGGLEAELRLAAWQAERPLADS